MADQPPPHDGDSPSDGTTRPLAPGPRIVRVVGPYHLLERLGEGGMGEVWLAEQTAPLRRRVALKLIKAGMDTKRVVARFEAERQALALMDHPAIAKVFDAGQTASGRPYFAMEYVSGLPITRHCDEHRLTTQERLRLFMQVCEAVQHAHQKAIIHRDLKPSNVLVTMRGDVPTARIIDFGIAKAMAQPLTPRTMHTELGAVVGTPAYMSPEQADPRTQDVDTRTDVYSLGAILYELLVGAAPYDAEKLRQAGLEGIRRWICEVEPPRPSARLRTLDQDTATVSARRRRIDVATWRRQLSGDLDWITMKALEKDRARRYGSPAELAADIGRRLEHRPVLAGPPSVRYRARKFVRRHRLEVAATGLVFVVLCAFTVTTTLQSRRVAREAHSAEVASEFLADMLGGVDPQLLGIELWRDLRERVAGQRRNGGAPDSAGTAAVAALEEALAGVNATNATLHLLDDQILSRAGEAIARDLADEPRIAGRLEHTLGETYGKLGLHDQAARHLERAVAIRTSALGGEHAATLRSCAGLADAYYQLGRRDEAEALFRRTLATQRRVQGGGTEDIARSLDGLAAIYRGETGRAGEADTLFREALAIRTRLLGPEHPETLLSLHRLAMTIDMTARDRLGEAEAMHARCLETARRALGPDDPVTLTALGGLAYSYWRQERFDEAEPLYAECIERGRAVHGDDYPEVFSRMNDLAGIYYRQGRHDEVEAVMLDLTARERQVLGALHPTTLMHTGNLGALYVSQNRYEEAERILVPNLRNERRVLGDRSNNTLRSWMMLIDMYVQQGRLDAAEPLVREILAVREGVAAETPDASPKHSFAYYALTCEPEELQDPAKALRFAREANEIAGGANWRYLRTLALAYHRTGDRERAVATQRRVLQLLPEDDENRARQVEQLAVYEGVPDR